MAVELCWTEFDAVGPVRIFRQREDAILCAAFELGRVREVEYPPTVEAIRRRIFKAANWTCVHCGEGITWYAGEMHERLWRGRGGEISLENGVALCYTCHHHDDNAGHGKRQVRWTRGS